MSAHKLAEALRAIIEQHDNPARRGRCMADVIDESARAALAEYDAECIRCEPGALQPCSQECPILREQPIIHDPAYTPPIPAHYPSARLCADILCTANEGGIGYWAYTECFTMDSDKETYVSIQIKDAECDEDWVYVIDYDRVRRGIGLMLAPQTKVFPQLADWLRDAVRDDDACNIDATVADCVIQFACFGEIVYG